MAAQQSRVGIELRAFRSGYWALFGLSLFNPLLYLSAPIFAQQIFDRVSLSRSETTLWVLAAAAMFMMLVFSILDALRGKTLQRMGVAFDKQLSSTVFDAMHREKGGANPAAAVALSDLNIVRDFATGPFVAAVFDAVWSPVFILVMFLIHPWMGATAIILMLIGAAMTALNHVLVAEASTQHQRASLAAGELGGSIWRNAETIRALGMLQTMRERWHARHMVALGWQDVASAKGRPVVAIVKFMRSAQPVFIYTIGGLLFLAGEIGMGSIIVAGIIMARALGPIDYVISNWRGFSNFRAARDRLDALLARQAPDAARIPLPRPTGALVVSRVIATPPESDKIVLNDVSFSVQPGHVLGVLGASGAGKSCLSRLLVGIWRPKRGSIALGDHELAHWNDEELGRHVGYVPQDIDLLPGTIAENISRFDPEAATKPERLLAAVATAGLADLIKGLPQGLNTLVGSGVGSFVPSGGQRQRLALARAVYGEPYLVVLDEPNAHLDASGEAALGAAIEKLRELGSIVVVVTHKMSLLTYCDEVVVLGGGVVQAAGPRAQVLDRLPRQRPGTPLTVVEDTRAKGGAA